MKTNWVKGLDAKRKEEVTQEFKASASIRSRLEEILQEKIRVKRSKVVSEEAYNSPGWAYLQADAVGYERALNEVISLIINEKSKAD